MSRLLKQLKFRKFIRRYKSDDLKIHSVSDSSVEKTPITAYLWEERLKSSKQPTFILEKTANEIIISDKYAADSKVVVNYSFSEDESLRDLYVDSHGKVSIGKLFEDLDALAGNVAFRHCTDTSCSRQLSLVTASVEKITCTSERSKL